MWQETEMARSYPREGHGRWLLQNLQRLSLIRRKETTGISSQNESNLTDSKDYKRQKKDVLQF